jgi:HEAT repeat protein
MAIQRKWSMQHGRQSIGIAEIVLVLGLVCMPAAGRAAGKDASDQQISKYVEQLRGDSELAKEALQKVGSRAVPALAKALGDPELRVAAIEVLGLIGPDAKNAAPALLETFRDTDEDNVFFNPAREALTKIGPQALPALADALASTNRSIRAGAMEALSDMITPGQKLALPKKALKALIGMMSDTNRYVPRDAVRLIGSMKEDAKETVPILVSALKNGNNLMREAAASALGQICEEPKITVPALTQALKDIDHDVRDSAITSLHFMAASNKLGEYAKEAVPALVKAFETGDPDLSMAANALREIGPDAAAAIPILIKGLESKDEQRREMSALALGGVGYQAALPLLPLLKHKDSQVRLAAADLLRFTDFREGVPPSQLPILKASLERTQADLAKQRGIEKDVKDAVTDILREVRSVVLPLTAEEIEKSRNLIVQITGQLNGEQKIGSGIIFGFQNDRLYIATARHVCRSDLNVLEGPRVNIRSLPGEKLVAELLGNSDKELDLAVLVVRNVAKQGIRVENIPFNRKGDPGNLSAEDKVFALGLPLEKAGLPTQPDEFVKAVGFRLLIQSNNVKDGYSGGALFDSNWRLVGMIRAVDPPFAHAIAIDQIIAQLKEWHYPVNISGPGE